MTLQLRSGRGDRLSLTRAKVSDTQTRLCAERRASVANRACDATAALPELYKPKHKSCLQFVVCRPQLLFYGRCPCLEHRHMCHCIHWLIWVCNAYHPANSVVIWMTSSLNTVQSAKTLQIVVDGFEFACHVTV